MLSGVHSSLHKNCQHQLIYSKFNLKIEYPHHIAVKFGISVDLRQTQLINPLKVLNCLIYFQVIRALTSTTFEQSVAKYFSQFYS